MASISNIYNRINFQVGKRESGYFNPDDIVDEVNAESKNLFNKFVDEFARTRRISEHLQPFMRISSALALTSGQGTLPADFAHANAVLAGTTEVEMVEIHQWATRLAHVNHPPTTDYPICKFENGTIYVEPQTIATIDLHYFKSPTDAVLGYNVSGNEYVLTGSDTDLEWQEITEDLFVARVLANLGISVKDQLLMQASEMERKEEAFIQ